MILIWVILFAAWGRHFSYIFFFENCSYMNIYHIYLHTHWCCTLALCCQFHSSFEDLLSSHHQGESTPSLPPVETVLPHNSCLHLITPSSISSPSISMNPANVTNSIHHRYQQHAAHNITQHMCHTINNHNLQHQTELFNNNHMSGPHYKSTQSQLFNVDHNCEMWVWMMLMFVFILIRSRFCFASRFIDFVFTNYFVSLLYVN